MRPTGLQPADSGRMAAMLAARAGGMQIVPICAPPDVSCLVLAVALRRLGARPHPALVVALRRCSSVTWPCAERESCGRPGRAAADRTGKGRFQRTALSAAVEDVHLTTGDE